MQTGKGKDELAEALRDLRNADQFKVVIRFLREIRENKISALEANLDSSERADAKLIGAIVEDDYLYKLFRGEDDGKEP
jgi:hypothetical protein